MCWLAVTCDFKAFTDDAIHDCFVCGLKNESTQQHLTQADLKLKDAVEKAINWEAATQAAEASTFEWGRCAPGEVSMYRCGRKGHSQQQCRFKEAICDNCGKKGHI